MHVLQMNIMWNNRETATANSKISLKDLGKIVTCSLLDLDSWSYPFPFLILSPITVQFIY